MDVGAHSAAEEAIANLVIGIGAVAFGYLELTRSRSRQKARFARKFGLPQEEVDALFRPVEGNVYRAFGSWQGAAIILIGVSRLSALLFGRIDHGFSAYVMLFAMANIFVAAGLSLIFTGRALYYTRRLMWQNYASPRDPPKRFDGHDSWWATLNILWTRLFGVTFLGIVLGIIYLVSKSWFDKILQVFS